MISDSLQYYIEVRQRPGTTSQIFDDNLPIGASSTEGGVIVTRVLSGVMNNNQQTRFITLLNGNEDPRVMILDDQAIDPARDITITVINDNVQLRPLVCRVRVEWGTNLSPDPDGKFDLKITPWDSSYTSRDIWVDREPFGVYDEALDSQGRPFGNGDAAWVMHLNHINSRIHVSGTDGADNVLVTFYVVSPPGVGDNGNWAPLTSKTISNIAANSYSDITANWVPVVGQHTCLRVFASKQIGEISFGNNMAQENVFDFQAAGSSPADPIIISTAVRNPSDKERTSFLTASGIPKGWALQIPHSWMHLDPKEEKIIEVVVIPLNDVNDYSFPSSENKRGLSRTAPIRINGYIAKEYEVEMTGESPVPVGSKFSKIGGNLYRSHIVRKSNITISQSGEGCKQGGQIQGHVSPAKSGQRVVVSVLFPDGKTTRVKETTTTSGGLLNSVVSLLDSNGKPVAGTFRIQASIVFANELANADSNFLYIKC